MAPVAAADLAEALAALDWAADDLDPALPPRVAYAGAHHLVLAAATRERLAELDYDFEALRALMLRAGWTTVQLVWREGRRQSSTRATRSPSGEWSRIRRPAPPRPRSATTCANLGAVVAPASITIRQGEDMGRPSRLLVTLDAVDPRVRVSGQAVPIRRANRVHPRRLTPVAGRIRDEDVARVRELSQIADVICEHVTLRPPVAGR